MQPLMDADARRLNEITERIIGCAYTVVNTLGVGFLEKVYENALAYELRKNGWAVEQQKAVPVRYDGVLVGDYVADLLVAGCVLTELKAVKNLDEIHVAQCLNYLKGTGLQVCLLLNFGSRRLQIRRLVHEFDRRESA
ncbi:MAG TPA: GxxExxY protein [Bryobacteraceae bacterium]|jgi:GxxExxY protein|nr:GxxExxY protein [Bryobacteraceae bacterium]